MRVPPMENPTCASFGEYDVALETARLDFSEEDVTWVASNISGATGDLGAVVIELRNWLIYFGFTSEDLRFVVANLADWMPPPPLGCLSHIDGMMPCRPR